ncbi:MAG: aminotransferase class I/II-fold pyridoxal phosphate-dependent enzyme [Sphaerochaetaceae bacterium]
MIIKRKIEFASDYQCGCHEEIMKLLLKTNMENTTGYGEDCYSEAAKNLIKSECKHKDIDIHFLIGGTQANAIFLKQALKPHQGVLCAESGHINCHEAGAIEASGHKVLSLPCKDDGKITALQVEKAWINHFTDQNQIHIVQPAGVYISQTTENGAVYSLKELTELSQVCRKRDLFLYVDGARLGYALASKGNDVTLSNLCSLTDAFYIGGTKCGALIGEAMVIVNPEFKKDFLYIIKQQGGLLAKGRLIGLQFKALFTNNLYVNICRKANELGTKIALALKEFNYTMFCDSISNQQFVVFDNNVLEKLNEKYSFAFWQKLDKDHTIMRICTSWSTKEEDVDALIEDLRINSIT